MVRHQATQTFMIAIIVIGIIIYFFSGIISVDAMQTNNSPSTESPKKNFDMIAFYWTVGIIGGCIALTLSYVSYRKYKAEESKKSKKGSK